MRTPFSRCLLALACCAAQLFSFSSFAASRPDERKCSSDWRSDHWCGWHFYEDPEPEAQPEKAPPKPPPPKPTEKPSDKPKEPMELSIMKEQQKRMEDLRNIAIVNPTFDNVRAYMEYEQFVYRQAHTFSEVARRVGMALQPLLPDNVSRPVNSNAAKIFDAQKIQVNTARLDELKNTHALFYFFRSDCPYCTAFSPVLARLEKDLGLKVVAISLDGRGTPEFPSFRPDNGIAKTLNVESVPALFIAEPRQNKVIALGAGVMSQKDVIERITLAVDPDTERLAPGLISSLSTR